MLDLSPICLFGYNRPYEIEKCLNSLSNCKLAKNSNLYIFIDGPKSNGSSELCNQTREVCNNFSTKFKKLNISFSKVNKGLSLSVITGVTEILSRYKKVIVLEDDLVVSENFLLYHNQCLNYYKDFENISSISGYNFNLKSLYLTNLDICFLRRSCSWGWSTWLDRWTQIDWSDDYLKIQTIKKENKLKIRNGGSDLLGMVSNQINGKIDSWSIKFTVNQLVNDRLTVYPTVSKLLNIGFNSNSTHTKKIRRFRTKLDHSGKDFFLLSNMINIDLRIQKEFNNKFSIFNRILDKF